MLGQLRRGSPGLDTGPLRWPFFRCRTAPGTRCRYLGSRFPPLGLGSSKLRSRTASAGYVSATTQPASCSSFSRAPSNGQSLAPDLLGTEGPEQAFGCRTAQLTTNPRRNEAIHFLLVDRSVRVGNHNNVPKLLAEVAGIVTPETLLTWHRRPSCPKTQTNSRP